MALPCPYFSLDFGVILLGRNGDKLAAIVTILPTAGNSGAGKFSSCVRCPALLHV